MSTTLKLSLALTMSPSTPRIPIEITSTTTAKELFDIVVESSKIPSSALKIIYRGKIITKNDDEESVATKFKLEDGSVIHCMGKPQDNASPAASSATSAAPNSTATTTPSMSVPVAASTAAVATPGAAASAGNAGTSSTLIQDLHKLQHEGCQNNSETYLTALKTIGKILDNIANNPQEEKYRQLKLANAAFQKRLGSLQGSETVLMKCGFVKTPDVYKLEPSAEKWNLLQAARAVVHGEITRVSAQQTARPAPSLTPGAMGGGLGSAEMSALAGMMGGAGGGAGLGGMPPLPPGMDMNMMQQMLSDPNAISSMLSNPMIQQMVENDPRFANNPQMRQALQTIRNNPGMVDQMSRMMADPATRERMQALQSMMGAGGPGGAMGGAGGLAPGGAGSAGQPQQQQPPINMQTMQQAMAIARMAQQQQGGAGSPSTGVGSNSSGGGAGGTTGANNDTNDDEMTEEEMIRQAIERSLREQ